MVNNELHSSVLTENEIEEVLGQSIESFPRISFDLRDVPVELHPLKPYAEFWGAADDSVRENVLRRTPVSLQRNLKRVVAIHED